MSHREPRSTLRTVEDVRARVEAIATDFAASHDNESAHSNEDDLYLDVLSSIAAGTENAAELAREALKANDLDFTRWYA